MRTFQRLLFSAILLALVTLSAGEIPEQDSRNTVIRHTDMHYTMPAYNSLSEWKQRAEFLRKQILFSSGLLPMPNRTPLKPQIFGRIEHQDYSIEKVLLETYPGFYLGGNLYRPVGKKPPFPAIVSPHGHWTYGRHENQQLGSIPARCISLARQGYVVFAYDMVGYGDTMQLPHAFGGKREELWMTGLLGLQTWDSIRAVDFVESLSEVDRQRIAATGASGGGTQTFLLAAVDDRVRYAAPVNMISVIMQGGSLCENAPNLRIDTFNVEIGALTAPRPMMMVSATGDWTRNTPKEEFPAIQNIYRLFDAEVQVETEQFDSPHNYHQGSREAVYRFFGKRILGDADATHFKEQSFHVEKLSDMMSLWGRTLPAGAIDAAGYIASKRSEAESQIESLKPGGSTPLAQAREAFREWLGYSLLASRPRPEDLVSESLQQLSNGETLLIGRRGKGDRVPAVILRPDKRRSRRGRNDPAVAPTLLIHPEGTAWVLSSSESRDGFVQRLLDRGGTVMGIDAFQSGRAKVERNIAGAGQYAEKFFTTFNRTDDANRVQDILTALAYLQSHEESPEVHLVGVGIAGVWCVFARSLAGEGVRLVADLDQFDAASDLEFEKRFFVPGIRKAGDFRAAAVLLAPSEVLLHNASPAFPAAWFRASYEAAAGENHLDLREALLSDEELIERIAPDPRAKR